MSASAWKSCPECAVDMTEEPTFENQTFREDYEIYGAEEGVVNVSYSGHCKECSTGVDFEYTVQFWPVDQ